MSFNAIQSALEGFRVTQREPRAILLWSLLHTFPLIFVLIFAGPQMVQVVSLMVQMRETDPSTMDWQAIGQANATLSLWTAPTALALSAMIKAAAARAVLTPDDNRFGYLRLGMDEVRVFGVNVVMALMFGALAGVVFLLPLSAAATPILALPALLAMMGGVVVLVWLALRLSLAVPLTVAEKRFAPFASFPLTKGRLRPLMGMAVLAGVMALLVSLLGAMVAAPLTSLTGGLESLAGADTADMGKLLLSLWPAMTSWVVISAVLAAARAAILETPFTRAYLNIKALGPK
jgi:hypothetical protein